jgi:hypothetical protein
VTTRREILGCLAPALLAWRADFSAERQLETDPAALDPEAKQLLQSLGYVH